MQYIINTLRFINHIPKMVIGIWLIAIFNVQVVAGILEPLPIAIEIARLKSKSSIDYPEKLVFQKDTSSRIDIFANQTTVLKINLLELTTGNFIISSNEYFESYGIYDIAAKKWFFCDHLYRVGDIAIPWLKFNIPININKNAAQLYLILKNKPYVQLQIKVYPQKQYYLWLALDFIFKGVVLGMALLMLLNSLFLGYQLKEKVYWYYALYIFSILFFAVVAWGWLDHYLLTQLDFNIFFGLPYSMIVCSLLLYTKYYLKGWIEEKSLIKIINIVLIIKISLFLFSVFTGWSFFNQRLFDNFYLMPCLYVVFKNYFKNRKEGKVFLLAIVMVYFNLLILTYLSLSNIADNYYYFLSSFCIEMLIFSKALSDRLRLAKVKEEQLLQQQIVLQELVNKELAAKVKERTKDLELANLEILRMNTLLAHDIDKIEHRISGVTQQLLAKRIISFDEFKLNYPSEDSCFKHLDNIKWQNGFRCRKCRNNESMLLINGYSRKCLSCKYIESPTLNTIFDKSKLPIQKNFYLLYVLSTDIGVSLSKLSIELAISFGTCLKLKQKLEPKIAENKKHKKDLNWTSFIK